LIPNRMPATRNSGIHNACFLWRC